jgi:ankyrin repeat protein
VERLLTTKVDVNAAACSNGLIVLQATAGGGHFDVVERLLTAKAKANPNANANANAASYGGLTTLQAASGGGHLDVVERLLTAKADAQFR